MVGILSSLRAVRPHRPLASEPLAHAPPPIAAPLDFPAAPRRSAADLARMIESEIIPRLMLAHAPEAPAVAAVGARTLEAFVRMTLAGEARALTDYAETLMAGGLTLEEVYVDLLIPTARRLGDDWNEDAISFTDVTVGLSRLQQVVRALGRSLPPRDPEAGARSAYFMPSPGEQHVFGLLLVEDEFRRAGWRTRLDADAALGDAVCAVGRDWFDLAGVSATSDTPVESIRAAVAAVRKGSLNPHLYVLVGGRLFIDSPELAAEVGADAAADTAAQALLIADKAVRPRVLA